MFVNIGLGSIDRNNHHMLLVSMIPLMITLYSLHVSIVYVATESLVTLFK